MDTKNGYIKKYKIDQRTKKRNKENSQQIHEEAKKSKDQTTKRMVGAS